MSAGKANFKLRYPLNSPTYYYSPAAIIIKGIYMLGLPLSLPYKALTMKGGLNICWDVDRMIVFFSKLPPTKA